MTRLAEMDYDTLLKEAAPFLRHMPGKHDQSTHGHGGGKGKTGGTPLTGSAALAAPPRSLADMTAAGDPRAEALWYRTGDNSVETGTGMPGCFAMSEHLRRRGRDPAMKRRVADIDSVMDESHLTAPVVVYRGMPTSMLGRAGELQGMEFVDKGFPSTSTDRSHAGNFGAATARITVPAGTPAVRMADRDKGEPESEIMLDRGLKFRVVAERFGTDERGRVIDHEVDLEVVPRG